MQAYAVAIAVVFVVFVLPAWLAFRREERAAREELARAEAAGRREPVTIRPWVDPSKCMGSGTCVAACPEKAVLQVVDGQARLANTGACVGHGACVSACPTGAIELRFGSERRGVDLPQVGTDFQTAVPGLYIAGELGGMGLIANAVEQGVQAVAELAGTLRRGEPGLHLIVVGAGPAGLGAAAEAMRRGLAVQVLEQGGVGGAILHYPRKKLVMSRGFRIPGRKRTRGGTWTKEQLLEEVQEAARELGLPVAGGERVVAVEPRQGGFVVRTEAGAYEAQRVLLALGRRGTPRKLGVPGEATEKVAYQLMDPEQHAHEHVLVVGGGDSAVEAAVALSEVPGCRVTLSYRRERINRPRPANQERLAAAVDAGRVSLVLGSEVTAIGPDRVELEQQGELLVLPNDRVFVFAGGTLPTALLASAGVRLERHFGGRVEELPVAPCPAARAG